MILITILVAKQQRSYKMKIENAQYIEDLEDKMIKASIDGVVWNVPLDPSNMHYAEILKQVDAGTLTIKDAD